MINSKWKMTVLGLALLAASTAQAATPTASIAPAAKPVVTPTAVTLPVPWKQGLKVRYQSSAVQEKVIAGKHEKTDAREITSLEIAEATNKGFLQVWRSLSPSVAITGDVPDVGVRSAFAKKMSTRFASIPLKVELDRQGAYVGLRNWQELGSVMREMTSPVLVQQARARPELAKADETRIRELLAPTLQRMTTQLAINSTLGKQAAIYNFFTAPSMTPGKPAAYEDTVPSPWSADVIPSVGSVELVSTDDNAGTVTLRWRQTIDPVKGAAVTRKIYESITGAKLPPGAPAGVPKELVLRDQAVVVLDRKSGLPLSLEHRREIKVRDNSSVSTWTLKKLVEPAQQ